MAGRKLSDWLSAYLEYTDNTEPPESYHLWTGISSIAGVLQRRVYMEWNFQVIYPNMYIVLIGPSGRCRKGTAMGMGKDLVASTKIPITAESTTREALIDRMRTAETSFNNPSTGNLEFYSPLTCFSDELSVFLGQNDVKFLANLTDWYDSHKSWTYETKGRGIEEVKGLCFNLLGATAPDWLQSILPEEAIGGGFTSRIIFVVEQNKRKTVPVHIPTPREKQLRIALVEDLNTIKKLSGHFEMSDAAVESYTDWYEEQDVLTDQGKPPIMDPKFAGYCDRRATHIKKIAMICAASRSNSMVIDDHDFTRALEIMVGVEKNMPRVFSGIGTSDYAQITEKVLRLIQNAGKRGIDRSKIMALLYRDLDVTILDEIEAKLTMMKAIKVQIKTTSSDKTYIWNEKFNQ